MKRSRNPVTSCWDCASQFESMDSYERHLSSRKHVQTILGIKNRALMECDEIVTSEQERVSGDEDFQDSYDSYESEADIATLVHSDEESFDDFEEMQDDEFPPLNADFDNTDEDFYPFPSEKFFLLYCYAHSIMRPKVNISCI